MPDSPAIQILPDGPIQVKGAGSVRFCGEPLDASGDLYLCRCGRSGNAPFCDGTHKTVGFSGAAPDAPDTEERAWEGRTVRTFFDKAACMHVFKCKPLNGLREAELAGDDAAAQQIMAVVRACPSGALTFESKGAAVPAEPASPVAIDIMEGGEIRVQTEFSINVPLQGRQPTDRATLCRCGESKNKPWCDGRHKRRRDFR